jgi:D-methionine transport system substrate-binding protein
VKKVAERDGLKIQIVEFTDYIQPNAALSTGDLDANSYQHKPFLDQQVKDRGYKITAVGYAVNFPLCQPDRRARAGQDKPWVAKLVKAYQSEEVRKFVQVQFKGAVIPGF